MPPPKYQRILVRGVNWLGDAVMTTPALLRLREAHPDTEITLLTHAKLKDLWHNHPAINRVETFAETHTSLRTGWKHRGEKYDLGVVLPNSPRSAFELWMAGIPERVGYAHPWRNQFLTQTIAPRPGAVKMHKRSADEIKRLIEQGNTAPPPPASAHHIYNYLHLIAAVGGNPEQLPPQLVVTDAAVAQFVEKFKLGHATTPWIGINPGAEYGPAKRWPEERFIAAASAIQKRTQCRFLIFGVGSDREMTQRIASGIVSAQMREHPLVVNLAGETSLGELCAALKLCQVLLTNDSGPMHVAAALGTPVVVPFGSTSPELTGPGLPGDPRHQLLRAHAPCSPCFLRECPIDFRCMTGISVEAVTDAVVKALR